MKHGGCYDCKGADQEILVSTTIFVIDRKPPGQESIALCDACLAARKAGSN